MTQPHGDEEINLSNQRNAMNRLFEERTRLGLSLLDLEVKSGVSTNSAYAWRKEERAPTLGNFVAFATVLGFDVILRKSKPQGQTPEGAQ